ncbi:uncharacterized protein LOC117343930 [Pecten maximus]|uniref:uncharacterized protein LOC117343930 n=1 Tax=Pecten maximus TaxID=6579 RepID=UPI0014582696|nr:uncharacterized protein LOC117343930 [Pecten maximus]
MAEDPYTTLALNIYFIFTSLLCHLNPGIATTEVYAKGGEIRGVGDLAIFPTPVLSDYEKSYWQGSTVVPNNYTDAVMSSVALVAISPSPSISHDNFVTSLECDVTRVNAVACLKVFPLTPKSRYERMYCMSNDVIRKKTNNKHTCNCETCTPDVHCWMSCQALAEFGAAPDPDCFCTPHSGGDGEGPIPSWCNSPQGQTEFFTECHSPLLNYSCKLYKTFFENAFSLTREHYAVWKSFSCKGATTEKLLISCLSKALVVIVNNTSVSCADPLKDITSCLISFRKELDTSSKPICQEAVKRWDDMSPNNFQLSKDDFEKEFTPARPKIYECLRVL